MQLAPGEGAERENVARLPCVGQLLPGLLAKDIIAGCSLLLVGLTIVEVFTMLP